MKVLAIVILGIFLYSCGGSKEDHEKKANELGKQYGEKYCDCIKGLDDTRDKMNCYEALMMEMHKKFDDAGFDEKLCDKGQEVFDNTKKQCE